MVYIYVLSIYIHAIYEDDDETYIPYDDTTIMWQNVSCMHITHILMFFFLLSIKIPIPEYVIKVEGTHHNIAFQTFGG